MTEHGTAGSVYPARVEGELSEPLRRWLADDPAYPARFDVEYPKSLSRGLVLVKWWLLALPHYVVVGVFTGGAWSGWSGRADAPRCGCSAAA